VDASRIEADFDRLYGLEVLEVGDERARARVAVRAELRASSGAVHGGVYASIAEGLASLATETAVAPEGGLAVGLANHTTVLHAITDGTIEALAVRRHRGRTTWVWQVDLSDEQDRLCVVSRVTVAVRDGGN
jgi:1,4-dihydroxy-2-naphthoyl-CoA hydrolase